VSEFIEEPLDGELLVYDTVDHRTHLLARPDVLKCWRDCRTDRQRRGLLAAGLTLGIVTLLAPTVAQAASQCLSTCGRGDIGKACERGGECRGRCVGRRCL
jgi:hypothetical protein